MDKDTIYRQMAIDAVNDLTYPSSLVDVKRKLVQLPSAQPEQQWISCDERLPEPNQYVLVSVKGEVDVDWIAIDYTGYGCWYRCMKDVMSVDAWMPLHEPYKQV